MRLKHGVVAAALLALACTPAAAEDGLGFLKSFTYTQTNLVSNVAGLAATTDPDLVDAWGLAFVPGSPFWINDTGRGVSTLYDGTGAKIPATFTVPPAGSALPTGLVWNDTGRFLVPGTKLPAAFIFATLGGTIAAWAPGEPIDPTAAVLAADRSKAEGGAIYTGLDIGVTASGVFLYAANIATGRIDVFDSSFAPAGAALAGRFVDGAIPAGYTPFNVRNVDGDLVVAYAKQNATKTFVTPGLGQGYVSIFDTDGRLLRHVGGGGILNAPWGIARAPEGFGALSGGLLIGNFGDGHVLAFDRDHLTPRLMLRPDGLPTTIPGLWALAFGGAAKSDPQTLFFTAGPDGGHQGVFGSLTAVLPTGPAGPH